MPTKKNWRKNFQYFPKMIAYYDTVKRFVLFERIPLRQLRLRNYLHIYSDSSQSFLNSLEQICLDSQETHSDIKQVWFLFTTMFSCFQRKYFKLQFQKHLQRTGFYVEVQNNMGKGNSVKTNWYWLILPVSGIWTS